MSTRMLLILGLVCIMIAGYFYRSGDSTLVNLNLKPSDIDYQANNIKAIQTDDKGNIHYQMTATGVTHYQKAQTAILENPNITLYQGNKQTLLTAGKATFNEKKQIAELTEQVKVTSNNVDNLPTVFKTEQLTGNLQQKTVVSNQKVLVNQNGNTFEAQTMLGNIATGDYQFERVAMTFLPVKP